MQTIMLIIGVSLVVYSFYSHKKQISNYSGELFFLGLIVFIWGASIETDKKNNYSSSINQIDRLISDSLRGSDYRTPSFNGYPCTSDCSGHEAGYEWAEKNGIGNIDDCDGKSSSFNEGCTSFLNGY